jgi:hypothetical protein
MNERFPKWKILVLIIAGLSFYPIGILLYAAMTGELGKLFSQFH